MDLTLNADLALVKIVYWGILDGRSLRHIMIKGDLNVPFSHDANLIEFTRFLVGAGATVYWASFSNDSESLIRIEGNMNNIVKEKVSINSVKNLQMIFSSDIARLPQRHIQPAALRVGFQPAVYQAEQPGEENPYGLVELANSLREKVDFVVTQNERMRELLFVIFGMIGGWKSKERILLAPLGPSELLFEKSNYDEKRSAARIKYGIPNDAVVILNAGGYWRWTDCNTFLEAFTDFIREFPDKKLYFIQPSFTQATNTDHNAYIEDAMAMIKSLPENLKSRVISIGSWHEGAKALDELLYLADIGLNVNNGGLENWLSHRVRVTNYLGAGLAILSSGDDEVDEWGQDLLYKARSKEIETYRNILTTLSQDKKDLESKKYAARILAKSRVNGPQYASLIENIRKIEKPLLLNPTSIFTAAAVSNLVPNQSNTRIAFMRGQGTFYRSVTQNSALHGFLVAIGVRAIYRKFKKS